METAIYYYWEAADSESNYAFGLRAFIIPQRKFRALFGTQRALCADTWNRFGTFVRKGLVVRTSLVGLCTT